MLKAETLSANKLQYISLKWHKCNNSLFINQLINVIRLFNNVLKRKSKEQNFDFLDLHKLTDRGDGMSNQIWHLDEIHLSPKGMQKAWMKYI